MSERTAPAFRSPAAALVLVFLVAHGHAQEPPPGAATPEPFDQAAALNRLRQSIVGKEKALSMDVWKNIQLHKDVPAGRLLAIMEMGYSRSLGVTCTHCHDVTRFEADDKAEKKIAREMANMVRDLNGKTLPAIPGLKSEKPTVNCTTCHRGQIKPALDLK